MPEIEDTLDLAAIRLHPGIGISPVEGGFVVLEHPRGGRYFRFTEQEYFLVTLIHSHRTLEPLLADFQAKSGLLLSLRKLAGFVGKLREFGLLEGEEPIVSEGEPGVLERLAPFARIALPLHEPDRALEALEPLSRALFAREFAFTALLLIAVGVYCLLVQRDIRLQADIPLLSRLLLLWGASLLIGVVHEYGHGLACKHFGCRVPSMGVMLYLLVPAFYCDTSDSSRLPRSERLIVGLAGLYLQGILGGLALLLLLVIPFAPEGRFFFGQIAFLSLLTSWLNLIPLVKLDGYYLLCDLTGVVNLRPRAFKLLGETLGRLRKGQHVRLRRGEPLLLAYALLGGVATLAMLSFGLKFFLDFLRSILGLL